jgi:dienelactone hydrolase
MQDATPEKAPGPYPLIVFAHGLGDTPKGYMNVLAAWASQGFVVAAPLFPLSNGNVSGGPDAGDVVNQPEDMSYVISSVVADSQLHSGILSGLVNAHEIGAAGHSNGAVTTLGLVANTCCYDSAVKAAVVMAGTTEGFPPGHYELTKAPPLLLVQGTADQLIPYRSAPLIYNEARGPKGLLTLVEGSHDAAGGQDPRSAATVIRTTTDFFEAYLTGSRQARSRLTTDGRSPTTKIVVDLTPGSRGIAVAVPPVPVVHLRASVSPNDGLKSGDPVTIRWSGYTAGKVVNILECSHVDISTGSSAGCTFANAGLLHPDPTGSGQFTMHLVTGQVGDGTCDSAHPCFIAVNNASSLTASNTKVLPISFAPGS